MVMKKAIIDSIKIIVAVIAVAAAVFFFTQMRNAKLNHTELQGLLSDTIHHFELVITDQGQEIAIQETTVASLENVVAAGIITREELKNKNLKQVDHIIKLKSQIVFLEELVAEVDAPNVITIDSVDCPDVDAGTYLRVPSTFNYSSKWITFDGTIYGPSIGIGNLTIRQEPTIFLGYQKAGLFKPLVPVVTVEDSNPFVHTVELRNVTIRQKPPFYSRPWFHFVGGAVSMVTVQVALNQLT